VTGLTPQYASADKRFEVDGANVARDFLRSHGFDERDIDTVWTAIALHTTPGIPQFMHPVIALVTAGVEMDVLGIAFSEFTEAEREAVVPRTPALQPLQGRDHPGLLRHYPPEARDDLRQCQGRCTRRQGSLLPADQFLPRDPRSSLARVKAPPSRQSKI
jgi:hypothetical protein